MIALSRSMKVCGNAQNSLKQKSYIMKHILILVDTVRVSTNLRAYDCDCIRSFSDAATMSVRAIKI